jgi:ABC-type multidrug transport system ATPase subunit
MPLLMGLCDRIYAMEHGQVIAVGTPSEIRENPVVVASYLGTDSTAIMRSGATNGAAKPARRPSATAAKTSANPARTGRPLRSNGATATVPVARRTRKPTTKTRDDSREEVK